MVTKNPFLTPAESHDFSNRLEENKHHGWQDNLNLIFGAAGIGASEQRLPDHEARLKTHNEFMRSVFPDLLEKLKHHFESILGRPCFFADELSYPGFHIFAIPPRTVRPLWFHYDDARSILENEYQQFGVTKSSRQLTFTCLLDSPPGLTAGLLYFPDQKMGFKVMSSGVSRQSDLEKFATFHEYSLGEMNFYERPVHSVYGRNDSDFYVDRVTLQGHIVETKTGLLMFR